MTWLIPSASVVWARRTAVDMHSPSWLGCHDRHHTNVGAGLPAIAVCQSEHSVLTYRYRRQASSHSLSAFQASQPIRLPHPTFQLSRLSRPSVSAGIPPPHRPKPPPPPPPPPPPTHTQTH